MNYNDFFRSALSAAYKKAPMTDDDTFMSIIKERAKNMKKENSEHNGLVEVTTDYTEPKKSAKVLHAVAGVAGAAAVLTGAVFGLKFLNEHGGLKEGGIGSSNGAGYHEDMTEPTQSAAETTNALIATEDIRYDIETPENVFEFDGVRAIVDWWQFDGRKLTVQYNVEFDGEPHSDYNHDNVFNRLILLLAGTPSYSDETDSVFSTEDTSQKRRYTVTFDKPTDSVTLKFYDWDDGWARQVGDMPEDAPKMPGFYKKIHAYLINGKTAVQYANTDFEGTKDPGYPFAYHAGKIVATTTEITFELIGETDRSEFENLQLVTVDFDGNETKIGKGTFVPNDNGGILSFPTNGIDIDIADVYYYSFERSTQISVDISKVEVPGEYEFLYYIDDVLQEELTEIKDISETDKLVWDISGAGRHTYKIMIRRPDTQMSETFLECTVDFSKTEPTKDFGAFNSKIFNELTEIQQDDISLIEGIYPPGYEPPYEVIEGNEDPVNSTEAALPEFPAVIGNNEFYGELLEAPITGDEAWELVKERGGIDYDYPFPYDKSIFKFTGTEFCIDYADFDVTALAGGKVEFAGFYQGWGNTVLILDDNGHYWLYGHLAEELNTAQGDTVKAGDIIGHTGTSGLTDHQLFSMRVG